MSRSMFAIGFCALCAQAFAARVVFRALGDLGGGAASSTALSISSDGSTVVGMSASPQSGGRVEAFRWTLATGMIGLGDLGGGDFMSAAGAVSADGSVIVGISESANGSEAFRWSAATGLVGLGDLAGGEFNSGARGVSDDGSVVVGSGATSAGFGAFRWTQGGGMQSLGAGDVPGGAFRGSAQTASSNGSVVYGSGVSNSGDVTFRWTATTGLTAIADLPGGGTGSEPFNASPDGRFCVGRSRSTGSGTIGFEGYLYDSVTRNLRPLGDLAAGAYYSEAYDVSADGSVVVGMSKGPNGESAFIWDQVHGMRALVDVLAEAGIQMEGWMLTAAWGLSADGMTITGNGINPDGREEAWIATIPGTGVPLVLFPAIAFGVLSRRRPGSFHRQ